MFDRAFEHVVGIEGGYVNDPRDPGGKTKFGISDRQDGKIDGKVDIDRDGKGDAPVEELTLEQAKVIYHDLYWKPARCDDLPWPLSLFVFDAAVNQGVGTAIKLLQKTLGVAQDGVIGNNTLAAIRKAKQGELCALYLADRALRYTGTRNFDIYGRGWLKRLFVIAMEK
jgi:lysozyme family protein